MILMSFKTGHSKGTQRILSIELQDETIFFFDMKLTEAKRNEHQFAVKLDDAWMFVFRDTCQMRHSPCR